MRCCPAMLPPAIGAGSWAELAAVLVLGALLAGWLWALGRGRS